MNRFGYDTVPKIKTWFAKKIKINIVALIVYYILRWKVFDFCREIR